MVWETPRSCPHFPKSNLQTLRFAYGRHMKNHKQVNRLIDEAVKERRCAFSSVGSENAALRRRAVNGELLRPARSLYVPVDYWNNLSPPERSMHMARAMAKQHRKWVFVGAVAAYAHGFEHSWKLHDGTVSIANAYQNSFSRVAKIRRVYVPEERMFVKVVDGVPVLGEVPTVLSCSAQYDFPFGLQIADSALRQGIGYSDLKTGCSGMRVGYTQVARVLRYADGASENGGESLCRAVIIDAGYMVPLLQVVFTDPKTGRTFRADFVWHLPDGRVVVGEYDGSQKYVDPQMTDYKSIQAVVQEEREREAALLRAGVAAIVRFSYDDAVERTPLVRKLQQAGIPRFLPNY